MAKCNRPNVISLWQALKREQLAALVGAADPTNPALVLIAAFCAKNLQNGNRAAQEYLLDWSELTEHKDEKDKTIGFSTEVALTKVDRKQVGERKPLQCPSTCQGEVVLTADGAIDANALCAGHLLKYARTLIAKKLGVTPEDVPNVRTNHRIEIVRLERRHSGKSLHVRAQEEAKNSNS